MRNADRSEEAAFLREQALRCRKIAGSILDDNITLKLRVMAGENEARAALLDAAASSEEAFREATDG